MLGNPRQPFRTGFDSCHFRFVLERAGNHQQVDVVVVDGEQMRRPAAVKGISHGVVVLSIVKYSTRLYNSRNMKEC